jgi:sortase A
VTRARRARPRPSLPLRIVSVIGELLITTGVLVGLFVVWQLWWTDIQAGREQEATFAALGWEPPTYEPAPEESVHRDDEPPVMQTPAEGETFGRLYVPRFGQDYVVPVTEGVGKADVLDKGEAGHYPETVLPGGLGNFSLAAHRTTYGKPFHLIADMQAGDAIVVQTEDTWYVYEATESLVVLPHQVEVIAPVPGTLPGAEMPEPTERFITLTTCHPMFSARERYIVHGTLKYWMPVSSGTPEELLPAAEGGQ